MEVIIRPMVREDAQAVLEMMRIFYASPAVSSNGSEEIFQSDIENCLNENPCLEGYVVEKDGTIQGYTMLAKSFATEFGRTCIWIEDLYLKEPCRGQGIGRKVLDFVAEKYPACVLRLEVEEENRQAVRAYEKSGFTFLPYQEMKKDT